MHLSGLFWITQAIEVQTAPISAQLQLLQSCLKLSPILWCFSLTTHSLAGSIFIEHPILLWQTKGITEGFFLAVMANIEEIGKQVAGWEKYLVKFLPKN